MDKLDDAVQELMKNQKSGFRVVKPDPVPEGNPDATTPEIDVARPDNPQGGQKRAAAYDAVAGAVSRHFGLSRKHENSNGPVSADDDADSVMVSVRPDRDRRTDEPADAKVDVYSRSKKKLILTQG